MKIYTPPTPPNLQRINIKRQGEQTEHIAVAEVEQMDLYDWIKNLIEWTQLSVFAGGNLLTIEIRESLAGKNGKVVSLSFKGMSVLEVKDLLLKNIGRE